MYWQGGDILSMESGRAEEILEIIDGAFTKTDIRMDHFIQTNLLGYNEAWGRVLKKYFKDGISSSIDYPNLYRKTPLIGIDDYNNAWIAKKKEAENDGFKISVISLVNERSLETGAVKFYDYYKNVLQVRSMQINFPFPGQGSDYARYLDEDVYGRFLKDLYDAWVSDNRGLPLSPFTSLERKMADHSATTFCIWSYSCADDIVSVAPNGDIAQCDCWILNYDEYAFGNLKDASLVSLMKSKKRDLFYRRPEFLAFNTECGDCEYWSICHGGCPIRSLSFTGNFMERDHFCSIYKKLFDLFRY